MELCCLCSVGLQEKELSCSCCHKDFHFKCGTGLSNITDRNFGRLSNLVFKCPLCSISADNRLIHTLITLNQLHNEAKHATDFHPGEIIERREVVDQQVTVDEVASEEAASEHGGSPRLLTGTGGPTDVVDGGASPQVSPPPVRRSGTPDPTVNLGSSSGNTSAIHDGLHKADIVRAKRLSEILGTLKNLPDHVRTVILGDSNTHHVRGRDVDPKDNTVGVRSAGGLCIPAAVRALKKYDRFQLKRIQRVVWSLGANDAIHGSRQHCEEDSDSHMKSLYTETKRIFPNATVGFILPFIGIKSVTSEFRKDLENKLKANCPKMKRYHPPSMLKMMNDDGTHINNTGRRVYINFLMKQFTSCKPQPQPTQPPVAPSRAQQEQVPRFRNTDYQPRNQQGDFRLPYPVFPPMPVPPPACMQGPPPAYTGLAREIAQALTQMMQPWRPDLQPQPNNHQSSWDGR